MEMKWRCDMYKDEPQHNKTAPKTIETVMINGKYINKSAVKARIELAVCATTILTALAAFSGFIIF